MPRKVNARRPRLVRKGRRMHGGAMAGVLAGAAAASAVGNLLHKRPRLSSGLPGAVNTNLRRHVRARRRGPMLPTLEEGGGNHNGDTSYMNRMWKPKKTTVAGTLKMLQRKLTVCTLRCQNIRRIDQQRSHLAGGSCPGAVRLPNQALTPLITLCPVHIYSLSSVGLTDPAAAQVGRSLVISDSSGVASISFNVIPTQNPDGTQDTGGLWKGERINQPDFLIRPGRYITTGWVDIKLNLYGCTDQPTVFNISLVKFIDQDLNPEESPNAALVANLNKRSNFWAGITKPLCFNPIVTTQPYTPRGYVVLRRVRRLIQPLPAFAATADSAGTANPGNHIVRIRYYDGKTRDHQWSYTPATQTQALSEQWQPIVETTAGMQQDPHPKARLYLLVTAMNTTLVASATEGSRNTPSYDFSIRKTINFIGAE